jgi:uncharacterized protein
MILESIITTRNRDGSLNVAPMGVICERNSLDRFELRPFCETTTFENLCERKVGVVNVTDDVLLFAQAVSGSLPHSLEVRKASNVDCEWLAAACRIHEFEVTQVSISGMRAAIQCRTVASTRIRDFFGFNRAMGQIIEGAILATRTHMIPGDEIRLRLEEIGKVVDKTGGDQERAAFDMICRYVSQSADHESGTPAAPEQSA